MKGLEVLTEPLIAQLQPAEIGPREITMLRAIRSTPPELATFKP
jgi:hypothetical protein